MVHGNRLDWRKGWLFGGRAMLNFDDGQMGRLLFVDGNAAVRMMPIQYRKMMLYGGCRLGIVRGCDFGYLARFTFDLLRRMIPDGEI